MADVEVKDNSNVVHQISVDTLPDGSQTQAVKLQMGDEGIDEGYVSKNNPLNVFIDYMLKSAMKQMARLSFDGSGQLRTTVAGSVSISGTAATNVTTGNIGIGDAGKTATNILYTRADTTRNLMRT